MELMYLQNVCYWCYVERCRVDLYHMGHVYSYLRHLMADREEVVAKLFVIPHHHSNITASQKGVNLQDIKDEVCLSVGVFVCLLLL